MTKIIKYRAFARPAYRADFQILDMYTDIQTAKGAVVQACKPAIKGLRCIFRWVDDKYQCGMKEHQTVGYIEKVEYEV